MRHLVYTSFPGNRKLIGTFLHCRTLNCSFLSSITLNFTPKTPGIRILPWFEVVVDKYTTVYSLKMNPNFCCRCLVFLRVVIENGSFMLGQVFCLSPSCMYRYFLPTMYKFSLVLDLFMIMCIFTVLYLFSFAFYCILAIVIHILWYVVSAVKRKKKRIYEQNKLIFKHVCLISNVHCDKDGQYLS